MRELSIQQCDEIINEGSSDNENEVNLARDHKTLLIEFGKLLEKLNSK
jgi:hypothetical protein